MTIFQSLFFRIIASNREVYALKIITLAIAFACSALIILFSLNEFGYDHFHRDASSSFRLLQRNNSEAYIGNRLSNRIPQKLIATLRTELKDSAVLARVRIMNELNVVTKTNYAEHQKIHAADDAISSIFSFDITDGSLANFSNEQTALLSGEAAMAYFGTINASGKSFGLFSLGDTIYFTVAAVYKDYPENSHEAFRVLVRYDSDRLRDLSFQTEDAGVYGRAIHGNPAILASTVNRVAAEKDIAYRVQPLPEIYFGPRVLGEDAHHGDHYSILILVCISSLILFLALTSYVNLTTLTLPHRSKELAIKKLVGSNQLGLVLTFAKESFALTGISLLLGIVLLACAAPWINEVLAINLIALLTGGDVMIVVILIFLYLIVGIAPLFLTQKFTRATPVRLLSAETITFPRFKRIIAFLQLGISIFLIVASIVIKRQINYSLLKEPGRNYDQIVYLSYPPDLTDEGRFGMRKNWRETNPNIVDVMATSQLPDRVSSKELNSDFYFMSVDRAFLDFYQVNMKEGHWFRPDDGDSVFIVNAKGKEILPPGTPGLAGVIGDMSGEFNLPQRPVKINTVRYYNYNFLCVRILEVDIRRTVAYLERFFSEFQGPKPVKISFLNKRFEEWLHYQDRLNTLSEILAVISAVLSCCAIYSLSVSLVRDKLKQIAIHKMCGASAFHITRILLKEFARQMLIAIAIFGPITFIFVKELLRSFVYTTHFHWLDPVLPLAYCMLVITVLCGLQALSLNKRDLTSSLKG